jgi:hypothetical protein
MRPVVIDRRIRRRRCYDDISSMRDEITGR